MLTSQIMDIASTLQMKAGLAIIDDQLQAVRSILAELAHKYRDTAMAGRTHLQHALPITFGYKMAVILSAFDRHYERLQQLRPRALMIQFGGAAGTLASMGDSDIGLRVRHKMAEDLGLTDPPISWHVARDGVAEAISFLAVRLISPPSKGARSPASDDTAHRRDSRKAGPRSDHHVFQRVLRG